MSDRAARTLQGDDAVQKNASKTPRRGSVNDAVQRRKYVRRPKPDMHAPKRPLSAYINFSKYKRNEYERHNWSFSTLAKQIGEDWRDLDMRRKNRYLEEAANDKLSYDQAMRRYKSTAAHANYKRYVTEFNRRHNSSHIDERRSSPDDSPLLSSRESDDCADGDSSMSNHYDFDPPPGEVLFKERSGHFGERIGAASYPPGTVNPASLNGTTPSRTRLDTSSIDMQPEHHHPESMSPVLYPLEHFNPSDRSIFMSNVEGSHNLYPCHLDIRMRYSQGHPAVQNALMSGFQRTQLTDDEMPYQQPAYDWTNAYISPA